MHIKYIYTTFFRFFLMISISATIQGSAGYAVDIGQATRPTKSRLDKTAIKVINQTPYIIDVTPACTVERTDRPYRLLPQQEFWIVPGDMLPFTANQRTPLLFFTVHFDVSNPAGRFFFARQRRFDQTLYIAFVYYWGYAQGQLTTPDDIQVVLKPSTSGWGIRIESLISNGSFKAALYVPSSDPTRTPELMRTSAVAEARETPSWVTEWDSPDFLQPNDPLFASQT